MTLAVALEPSAVAAAGDRVRPAAVLGPPRRPRTQRLLEAMTALEDFPALAYSRDRLLGVLSGETVSAHQVVRAIESDPALAMHVLRLANRGRPTSARPICGIPDAVAALAPGALCALARKLPVFDFFGAAGPWSKAAQHFRIHSAATLCVSERLVRAGLAQRPDELRVAAVLHDVGKLVVLHAYGRYTTGSEAPAHQRVLDERRALGLDHAVVGGVIARRLGLPNRVATLIERHHSDEGGRDAALLRLADLLVHYSAGHPVDRAELVAVAERSEVVGPRLDALLYELPTAAAEARRIEPSPLSRRQTEILQLVARGRIHKQIAVELRLAPSTIRSHLHAAYAKLGVANGTQGVLLATDRGWLQ